MGIVILFIFIHVHVLLKKLNQSLSTWSTNKYTFYIVLPVHVYTMYNCKLSFIIYLSNKKHEKPTE